MRLLTEFWKQGERDLVVSLIPNFNRALRQSLPATPLVTILTDLADFPPHFWIERQDQYLICGTEKAVEQARVLGHPAEQIFATSGMILRPSFYEPVMADRAAERRRLGLDPELPTGLVLFGGQGSSVMPEIAKRMSAVAQPNFQFIFICGRNKKLAEKLRGMDTKFPKVRGRVHQRNSVLHASLRFLCRQAGPRQHQRSDCDAASGCGGAQRLDASARTLQHRMDSREAGGRGVAIVPRASTPGCANCWTPPNFSRFRTNAAAITNRAVFEIPEILETLLQPGTRLSPIASPTRNSGQLNGVRNPARAGVSEIPHECDHDHRGACQHPGPVRQPAANSARAQRNQPQTIMVNATSTGAHTGPTQGSGIRNKMSQVRSESGQ